jgi:putative ABC transport system ATP-binding protein
MNLDAARVTVVYGHGAAIIRAVDAISVQFRPGTLTSLCGPSGSGKTTLLAVLGGILKPTEGSVSLVGSSLYDLSDDERATLRLKRIGFVFQSFRLFRTLTALENVALPLGMSGSGTQKASEMATEMLGRVGLGHKAGHRPNQLSGGEQQRIAVARALVTRPAVVLADEPTASLDSANGRHVVKLLRDAATELNQTVIIVTHDRRLNELADRVITMTDGRVASDDEVL